jgi:cytochrome P450
MSKVRDLIQPLVVRGLMLKERMRTGVVWNPLDDGYHQNPYETYTRLRERDPMHASSLTGAWVFSRHADCDAILRDHRRFSNDARNADDPANDVAGNLDDTHSMLMLDPPDHTRLRSLVSLAFTPKALEAWRPRIEAIVDRLLDEATSSGQVDMLDALAVPLPTKVIAEMLGIPTDDLPQFKVWSDHVSRTLEPTITPAELEQAQRSNKELAAYFEGIIEQRRTEPRDDLVTQLIAAEEAGDQLTHEELQVTLRLILVAGNETTTNLIGNGLLALLRHPDQLERLRREPELMESAVDELLRYDSPVQTDGRTALEDIEWNGKLIKQGQQVFLLLGAANRDPDEFPNPDELDVSRGSKRHMSFGRGIHHCLGAPLARIEAQVAFGKLLERYESLELVGEPRFKDHIVLRGLRELPVEVVPARVPATATV